MHRQQHFIGSILSLAIMLVATSGCTKRQLKKLDEKESSLRSQYDGGSYAENIMVAEGKEYQDQGKGISAKTLTAIQDTITTLYERDFVRCLQKDMDAFENRWIAGTFTVEFTINTAGKVIAVRFLEMDIKERRLAEGQSEAREVQIFPTCAEQAMYVWEFNPAPEVEYVHTYFGKLGEAF